MNLHTAPGVGNAMGAIFNAQANKSPLVITAGQQYRSLMTLQANLTNRDATRMPHPLVKWSYEPPCAQDVPHAIARAAHLAALPPKGPVFVSIPMDDWDVELQSSDDVRRQSTRTVTGRRAAQRGGHRAARRAPARRAQSGVRRGPGRRRKRRLGRGSPLGRASAAAGVRLARSGGRADRAFPRATRVPGHAGARGRPAGRDARRTMTSCWWRARLCSPTTRTSRARCWREGTELLAITSDPDEAARAPMGDAIVGRRGVDARGAGRGACRSLERAAPTRATGARGGAELRPDQPIDGGADARRGVPARTGSSCWRRLRPRLRLRNQLRLSRPGSYYFGAGGGLGFGLSAAIGVQLAQPDAAGRVRGRRGLGAVRDHRASGRAAAYNVPVTFLVLRNDEYAILKWFGMLEDVSGAPGLDLPALDCVAVAPRLRRATSLRASAARGAARSAAPGDRLRSAGAGRGAGHAGHGAGLIGRCPAPRNPLQSTT